MDEFLSGLANYTEKENPCHPKGDACPGTEFHKIETIMKILSPLIVFSLKKNGNGSMVFTIDGQKNNDSHYKLRYYLNYTILPAIKNYMDNPKRIETCIKTLIDFDANLEKYMMKIYEYLKVVEYANEDYYYGFKS
uniref:Uncharacterized protein n=1 Tax=viral metagenome TaxID=1070528 RepID=A0A6C0FBZ8_9ZZZZ|tara:strand:+ start:1810 stop:2217 length:408 start_codon:yes stop_codon:yes gene_type:complete